MDLFIDNLLAGNVIARINLESRKSWIDGINNIAELRETEPDSDKLKEWVDRMYRHVIDGRINGWIEGAFIESDLEERVASLTKANEELTKQRDDAVAELANIKLPPENKNFKAVG